MCSARRNSLEAARGARPSWLLATPTTPRPPPDRGPTGPRPVTVLPRPVAVWGRPVFRDCCGDRLRIEETGDERLAVLALAVVDEFVDVSLRVPFAMEHDVLELDQAPEMDLQLRVSPPRLLAHEAPREAVVVPFGATLGAVLGHHLVEQEQEPSRLRRKLVEGSAEDFVRESIRELEILFGHFDEGHVFTPFALRLARPLVLMQERHGADQAQVLRVIAARTRERVGEGQRLSVWVDDEQRLQEALGVLVERLDAPALALRKLALERLGLAL